MRKMFLLIAAGLMLAAPAYTASIAPASAAVRVIDCTDPDHPGGYEATDGKCHTADDKAKFPPLGPSSDVVDQQAGVPVVEPHFTSMDDFTAKCAADGGQVMDSVSWNAFQAKHPSEGPHIPDGSFRCYIAAHYN